MSETIAHRIGYGYRRRLATLLPAIDLAYFMLVWPLVYARYYVPADLSTGPIMEAQPGLLNRLFFPGMAALSVILLIAERHRIGRFQLFGSCLLIAFFGYLGLTAAWALAPAMTLTRLSLYILLLIGLVPALLLADRMDDILRPMFWVTAVAVAVNVASIAVVHTTSIGFPGIYSHKNTLGANAAIAGLFAIYALTRADHRVRVAGFLCLPAVVGLLLISQSKTSLGMMVLAPATALFAAGVRRRLRIALPILMVVLTIPAAFLLGGGVPGFDYRDVSLLVSGDPTFTGRTEIWKFTAAHIAERPLTGWGFQSFWGIGPASPAARMTDTFIARTPHSHNGYLDMALEGGMIALSLFLMIVLMIAWWIDRLVDRDAGSGILMTSCLLYTLWQNLLETDWLHGMTTSNVLLMLMMLSAVTVRQGRALT
ncbi:putative exopolysaccharide production protein, ExoQ-like protein [uncultured Pleomorphomonas sp.]|uniref:Putative exopolysaccharide production protein, ExoQ-like protein n=1 Tax=uncultured Pleomorphomonas sp. TaxID=442121 RepID=A0A212LF20_9HYPH|nr:O-antigen ligase family protein [uncultured Pleomorphomonas sp.]SCM76176.1 putative exopolysaccharide production protein, ExoQ-like protein [uncultured Pleomorphomonas sp.]